MLSAFSYTFSPIFFFFPFTTSFLASLVWIVSSVRSFPSCSISWLDKIFHVMYQCTKPKILVDIMLVTKIKCEIGWACHNYFSIQSFIRAFIFIRCLLLSIKLMINLKGHDQLPMRIFGLKIIVMENMLLSLSVHLFLTISICKNFCVYVK